MPSNIEKLSKTAQSNLSHSDQSPSSWTPASSTPPPNTEVREEMVTHALEEASRKYPSLISKSAFIGQVTDVDTGSKGCNIWLSESSMVSSSIAPGSIVSVSLVSIRKGLSNSFPLSSLADECARNIGIDFGNTMANQAGNYFALAIVFPSCKVLKDGVRLSSSLSYTMGCPDSGRFMFVNPIENQSLAGTGNGNDKPLTAAINGISLYDCKELYLELASSRNGVTTNSNMSSSMKFSEETSDDGFRNHSSSSPKTPLYQSKLRSPNKCQLTSSTSEKSVLSLINSKRTSLDSFDVREVLGDESAKKLLQTCTTSWLRSRSLLHGNPVTILILSKIYFFQVIGANRLLPDDSNQDWTGENGNSLFPQALKLVDDAFVVVGKTKAYLSLPLNVALKTPHGKSLPLLDLEYENVKAKVGGNISRLGGLRNEYTILKDIISSSVKDTLSSLGLRSTKGVLLHGPPGTGKTSLVRLCAHDAGVNIFFVNGPEIVSQYYGESEKALHEVFDSASQAAPAVVFIDELDAIAPARKDGGEELSQRLVATLLNLMDGICRTDGLLVIAATNRPDCVEPALRRPGRLDREIEIGVPSPKQRLDILLTLISEMEHSLSDAQVQQLAMDTHGFVGADLSALCNEAALVCLRHYVMLKKCRDAFPSRSRSIVRKDCSDAIKGSCNLSKDTGGMVSINQSVSASSSECLPSFSLTGTRTVQESMDTIQNGFSNSVLGEDYMLKVTFEDFEKARIKVKPSAMREVILEVPKVNWEDVGGQKEVKAQLMEAVEWPQKYRDAFRRIGTSPPTGVLLFGPPGCSKTLMARAVASKAGLNFLAVKGPELFSKWVGESEKAVRSLFAKARANAPSIIFFDEIDGLAVIRGRESDGISVADRVMSQLLVELDGLHQRVNVTVIAATNRPDKIDPALLRPGRFDRLLYVGPPNESDRQDIFHIHLRKIPCGSDVSIKELASLSEGCTGADISLICREAAVAALEENLDVSEVRMNHLKTAISLVQPSEIPSYQELSAKFQRLVYSSAA